ERLNEEIIQVTAAGQKPNDLLDRRDLLLDKLSSKFGINIEKKVLNGIDVNTNTDDGAKPPTIPGTPGTPSKIKNFIQAVNPDDAVRLAYISSISPAEPPETEGTYTITYYKNADMTNDDNKVTFEITLDEKGYKDLDRSRTLWTDKSGNPVNAGGEVVEVKDGKVDLKNNKICTFQPSTGNLNGYMSVQDDIDNQIDQLDKLARSLAYAVNFVHEQDDADKISFFLNRDGGAEDEITAGNITVNEEILKDVMKIKVGKGDNPGETDGTRALAIANIMDRLIAIQNIQLRNESGKTKTNRNQFIANICGGDIIDEAGIKTIKGNTDGMTYGGYFKDMVDRLGVQTQEAKRMVKNQHSVLASFQQSRDAVSGVSLDEEMTNLI
ncbi:hypothetical protein KUA25_26500, partial [Bacteroidales bacterium MSK.15.36]|nr:hypothetical protein [Bacteroidales bacterium MSK.15.36]